MLHARAAARRPGTLLGVGLACLLVLVALPAAPPRAARALMPVPSIPPGHAYRQTNLASNVPGLALVETPLLKSAWGLSVAPGRPFCVADSGTGMSLRFATPLAGPPFFAGAITIPGGNLTACDANGTGYFRLPPPPMSTNPRVLEEMFVTLDGRLLSYHPAVPSPPSTTATPLASFGAGTILTGVAVDAAHGRIFLADFGNGRVLRLDQFFNVGHVAADPTMPSEYRPYNVRVLGGKLYVTYAKRDPGQTEPDTGSPGNGYVSVFDLEGNFLTRLVSRGPLRGPWGLALAPPDFGVFGGALLVGNHAFNGASVNAFDPVTGEHLGALRDETGTDIVLPGLRGLAFGAGGISGDPNTLYFTSSGSGDYALFGSLSPTAETASSLVGFRIEPFEVGEGAGHADITVTREGDLSAPATVNYTTMDVLFGGRLASHRSDYELAVGKLTFGPGEAEKSFRVLVNGDSYAEGIETVTLALSNPTGAGVGLGRSRSFLFINDTPPPIGNPVDDASYFVFQHYHDFLNRGPDPSGHEFWASQIAVCPTAPCRDERRANVSAAFFLSIEFQATGMLNILAHRAAYGRRPFYGEFTAGTQALQRGVVFGAPGAAELMEANKQSFFLDFVGASTFASRYHTTMTPEQFVDVLYANAGVTPAAEERAAAVAEFPGPGTADVNARARVLRRVAENGTFAAQEFNRAFVLMQYFGYLRREPDEAGFQFWLSKLNEHNGNYITAEMVRAFIESAEYRRRFAPN